jgi:hypothetical protein
MSTLREAAEMALAVLEDINKLSISPNGIALPGEIDTAMDLLRDALASQIVPSDCSDSHQPDAWMTEARNEHGLPVFFCASEVKQAGPGLIPLYTAPLQSNPIAWDVFISHGQIYFSIGNQSFSVAYTPDDDLCTKWYMGKLRYALSYLATQPQRKPLTHTALDEESKTEPFGYFRSEPFGWTDCAKDDDGAVALYEAPPQRKPLTEEELNKIMTETWGSASIAPQSARAFARAIERAHGIGSEE